MSEGLTSIGYGVFDSCTKITTLDIPASVTSIGDYAFRGCSGLTSVNIKGNISSVASLLFSNCTSLRIIKFTGATSVPTLQATDAFTGLPSDYKIYVPANLLTTWKAATNWATIASHIVSL